MPAHAYVMLVTLVALLVYLWMGIEVAKARRVSGISAPAMSGDPRLERTIRAHYNTMEWLPAFLASMWIFAACWNECVAAGLGVVWILGRILYQRGYVAAAEKRGIGFLIQALATFALLFGSLGRIVWLLVTASH